MATSDPLASTTRTWAAPIGRPSVPARLSSESCSLLPVAVGYSVEPYARTTVQPRAEDADLISSGGTSAPPHMKARRDEMLVYRASQGDARDRAETVSPRR